MVSYSRNINASYIGRRVEIVAMFFVSLILPIYSWGLRKGPYSIERMDPEVWNNKYNSTGIGLKGSVYEILGYSINPTYKFGENINYIDK